MSNHSVVEHRASYYYIRIEEDMLAICSKGKCSPHCKALILAILESWMNTKRDRGEGEYIYLTMPQWIKHTYMLYQRNVITDCIHELIEEKLIVRRPIKRYDQNTFEYTLNLDVLNAQIRILPSKPIKETQPNLDLYIAFRERSKATRAKGKEGVGEKSPTLKSRKGVREKSPTVGEKSQGVGEKSTQHSIPTKITSIDSPEREGDQVPHRGTDQHPTEDSLALTQFFIAFDNFYRSKEGYIEHFMLPRNEKNKEAIKQLIEMGSTHEQALFVLEDIWNDPDPWWKKNRTISSVVSQFTTRIVKMPKTSKQNSQSATKKTAGMSEAEAVQLAEDIMQIAHITHYDIQAQAAPTKNSAMWIVQAVLPDGPGTIRSRSQWNTFWEAEQQSVQMEGVR